MSDQKTITDDSSRLSIMAAAVEHMSSAAAVAAALHSSSAVSMSPSRRAKLVLPTLTPAMQQDLALSKGSGAKSSKPLSIGTRHEFADYPLTGIVTPHPNDVLCGRGGGSNNHPGNESFRELVNEVKVPYVNCPKREKPLIARRIVEAVRNQTPPGRFLSKDTKGLWNDIGDGKGREKTSQALREGAPIIRDMIGKPTSPSTNVASVLKEAKKVERAEKEYCVKLPNRSNSLNLQGVSPTMPNNETNVLKRRTSMGSSPHNMALSNSAPLPTLKKFRSFCEKDIATNSNGQQPVATWHPVSQQPGRNFNNMVPYAHMMGGFAAPPRGPMDYANGNGMPRYPDSVPVETVRRLLLGQLDPIQLAMQLLSPEEVTIVASRRRPGGMMTRPPLGPSPTTLTNPLPLMPLVSDGSSTTSSGDSSQIQTIMQRATSDQSSAARGGDDGSSVDSSKQSSDSKRALPRKKRKYVEASA